MRVQLILIIAVIIYLSGCSQITPTGNPTWVNQLIEQFESEPVGNPPLSIWQYEYNGRAVYFIPTHCCDIPSTLYDIDGNILCEPDGGIKGNGDGRCPDFFTQRTDEQIIWQDPR